MIELVKAKLDDRTLAGIIHGPVRYDGIILNRNEDEVATNIRSYILAKENDELIGYTALHVHSKRLAEIRSLIVNEKYRGQKIGQLHVELRY